jgi:ribose 5-phosphate isomerase B
MRLALAADHAGFELKSEIAARLRADGHAVIDETPSPPAPDDDYPDAAALVVEALRSGRAERGILVCGSGVGACVAANKAAGIRAGLCHDTYSAHQGVEHDDINVLCLGSRVVGSELACEVARTFVAARFSGGERHLRRLAKIAALDRLRD